MVNKKIYKNEKERIHKVISDILEAKENRKFDPLNDESDNEDDDQNFIKQDGSEFARKDSGILPESNQQRNLDRENGGLEAKQGKAKHVEDLWDNRNKEIAQMNKNTNNLNHSSVSTRDQSFIHRTKQQKKDKNHKHSFVEGLNEIRKARLDKTTSSDFEHR